MKFFRVCMYLLLGVFAVCAVADARLTIAAAGTALRLWATAVVPALLPFFVAARALLLLGAAPFLARLLSPLMRLLGYPVPGAYALAVSLLGGYPGGAKAVCELKAEGAVTPEEAARLSLLCHTSGPLFTAGTAACSLLQRPQWGLPLLVCHYAACFCSASLLALRAPVPARSAPRAPAHTPLSLGAILSRSVTDGINTMLLICGCMVFFGVVIALLPLPAGNLGAAAAGLLEMTAGIARLSGDAAFPLACALLSFSGACICLQALSLLDGICRPLRFFAARLLCGVLGGLLGMLFQATGNLLAPAACAALWITLCGLFRKLFA